MDNHYPTQTSMAKDVPPAPTAAPRPENLVVNQTVYITGTFRVGISWDTSSRGMGGLLGRFSRKVGTDLDLLAIACRADGEPVRMAGLDNLDPFKDGSMTHSGDNQSGHGEGDDESVLVYLDRIPAQVDSIVFMAAAYKRASSFGAADNVAFKVYGDTVSPTPFGEYWPSLRNAGTNNACIIARIARDLDGIHWGLTMLEKMTHITQGNKDSALTAAMRAR